MILKLDFYKINVFIHNNNYKGESHNFNSNIVFLGTDDDARASKHVCINKIQEEEKLSFNMKITVKSDFRHF